MRVVVLLIAVSLVGCMDGDPSVGQSTLAVGVVTDCWIQGNGTIDPDGSGATDSFSGEIRHTGVTADSATGIWVHESSFGDTLLGSALTMECRANGGYGPGDPTGSTANLSDFDGVAKWNGVAGYTFRVHGEDRGAAPTGDVGNDFYSVTVFDPDGDFVYFAGGTTTSGNYELFPPDYVPPQPGPGECDGPRGHGRGHDEHGRGHGYGHDRHGHCDDDD